MPMMAMLRNLGKMTALGLFDEGNDLNTAVVISKLTLVDMLQAARIHPIKVNKFPIPHITHRHK